MLRKISNVSMNERKPYEICIIFSIYGEAIKVKEKSRKFMALQIGVRKCFIILSNPIKKLFAASVDK